MIRKLLGLWLLAATGFTFSTTLVLAEDIAPVVPQGYWAKAKARWERNRALGKLQKIIQAKPRKAVQFRERFGKLGGRGLFSTKTEWAGLGFATAIDIASLLEPNYAAVKLLAGTLVGVGTTAHHYVKMKKLQRQTIISMIEDKTISDTDLKPFRKVLGLSDKGRQLTPELEAEKHRTEKIEKDPSL